MELPVTNPFPAADKAAWRAQVQKDLKDPSAPDSLRWPTPEGFTLDPYYTAEDLTKLPVDTIQAAQKTAPGWLNAPERLITNPKTDNSRLRNDLTRGADALVLDLNATITDVSLSQLLNGIKLSDTPVFFRAAGNLTAFVGSLKTIAPYQLKGGLLNDPIARQLRTGEPAGESLREVATVTEATTDSPQFRTICADSTVFHNAGATTTHELALLFGSLTEQYDVLTNEGITVAQLGPKTMLSLSVGTSYFMEIAKLRALRVFWQRFLSAYRSDAPSSAPYIHAQTSTFYSAAVSPYTNLLRATTEAMSAVVGGCDVLTVLPYDTAADNETSDFSDRIARNVSVLLTQESYMGKVADPSAGSYYIESLTHELTEAAWTYFLKIEAMGGLLKAFDNGFIQTELAASYKAKVDVLKSGRVMVGVNKFREAAEATVNPIRFEEDRIGSLKNRRLANEFE